MTIRTATVSVAFDVRRWRLRLLFADVTLEADRHVAHAVRFLRHSGEAPGSSRCCGGEPRECRPGNSLRRWRLVYRRRAGHDHCACRRHLSTRGDARHACVADMPRSTRGLAQGGLRRAWFRALGRRYAERSFFRLYAIHRTQTDRACPGLSPAVPARARQRLKTTTSEPFNLDTTCSL